MAAFASVRLTVECLDIACSPSRCLRVSLGLSFLAFVEAFEEQERVVRIKGVGICRTRLRKVIARLTRTSADLAPCKRVKNKTK